MTADRPSGTDFRDFSSRMLSRLLSVAGEFADHRSRRGFDVRIERFRAELERLYELSRKRSSSAVALGPSMGSGKTAFFLSYAVLKSERVLARPPAVVVAGSALVPEHLRRETENEVKSAVRRHTTPGYHLYECGYGPFGPSVATQRLLAEPVGVVVTRAVRRVIQQALRAGADGASIVERLIWAVYALLLRGLSTIAQDQSARRSVIFSPRRPIRGPDGARQQTVRNLVRGARPVLA